MVDDHDDHEEDKDDDLRKKTGDDDPFGDIRVDVVVGGQSAAAALDGKGEDIAHDENAGEPSHRNQRVSLAAEADNEALEGHVDRGSKQRRGDEDEDELDGVRHKLVGMICGDCSYREATSFHCTRSC